MSLDVHLAFPSDSLYLYSVFPLSFFSLPFILIMLGSLAAPCFCDCRVCSLGLIGYILVFGHVGNLLFYQREGEGGGRM